MINALSYCNFYRNQIGNNTFIGKLGYKTIISITYFSIFLLIGSIVAIAIKIYKIFLSNKEKAEEIKALKEELTSSEKKRQELTEKLETAQKELNRQKMGEDADKAIEKIKTGEDVIFKSEFIAAGIGLYTRSATEEIIYAFISRDCSKELYKFNRKEDGSVDILKSRIEGSQKECSKKETLDSKLVKSGHKYRFNFVGEQLLTIKEIVFNTIENTVIYTVRKNEEDPGGVIIKKTTYAKDGNLLNQEILDKNINELLEIIDQNIK